MEKSLVLSLGLLLVVSVVLATESKKSVGLSEEEKAKVKISKEEAISAAAKCLEGKAHVGDLMDIRLARIPPNYYWADKATVLAKKKPEEKVEKIGKNYWMLIGKPRRLQPAWVLTFKKKKSFSGEGKAWVFIDSYTKELLGGTETN